VTKNDAKLSTALEALALADPDDGVVRKKLAQMALAADDFENARKWATETIHCDVMDVEAHKMLAAAYTGLKQPAEALFEHETLVKLEPDDAEAWAGLLRAARTVGDKPDVVERATKRLRELDADHAALKDTP
jgi:Flp pilus assembly protein TadD